MNYTEKTTARLSKKFAKLRVNREMSVSALARRSGVSRRTIDRVETAYETGHVAELTTLNKLARAFRTTVANLSTLKISEIGK